jgi:hypothetical protein
VQIKKAIATLHGANAVVELRAIHKGGRKRVDAGYFDGGHRDLLVAEAIKLNTHGAAVYVTMNEVDPQLLSRTANRIQEYAQATATDSNVIRRQWLLIDIDPQRPKDTSATHEQLALALERAKAIHDFLTQRGWPNPASADSGNGLHFLYRVDLPNDEASRDLVKHCLEALASRFDDEDVKVDRSVFNAARITKLYGTVANKGDDVPTAPWRLSKLRSVPDQVQIISLELLHALAAEVNAPKPNNITTGVNGSAWSEADVQDFLARGGIEATGPEPHEGASRWKLKTCPFNSEHGYGESAVFLRPDGKLGFDCRHNSCADKHWADLRSLVDGERGARRTTPGAASVQAPIRIPASPTEQGGGQWPSPTPLPAGLPPVAPFEYELLPTLLHRRVEDIAERMQCPPDFPAVALIVMLSSLIGRRCGIAPKRADEWVVVPNLWGMAIGRPGIMKSPPLTEIMRPLQVLQARAFEIFEQEQAGRNAGTMVAEASEAVTKEAIRKLLKKGQKAAAAERAQEVCDRSEAEPVCRRYVVNDSTVEKLGEILNQNRFGVLLFRDELNGFFRTLERHGHEADRAFYLECWNGDNGFTYDRIGRGTLHIEGACLSILGSIQPGPLSDLVRGLRGSGDDGLLQRFQLGVWPDAAPEWRNIDRPPDREARDAIQTLIERFDRMTAESLGADPGTVPMLRFSDDAQSLFDVWREVLERRLRDDSEHPMLEAHLAKYRSLVPSLALVIHLTEASEGPIEKMALERAIGWAEYLESHARRIYAPAISPDMDAARLLAKRIGSGTVGTMFALRDIYNRGWTGLATRDEVAAAVSVLIDHDWLREFEEATPGRTRTLYRVNPAVAPA